MSQKWLHQTIEVGKYHIVSHAAVTNLSSFQMNLD